MRVSAAKSIDLSSPIPGSTFYVKTTSGQLPRIESSPHRAPDGTFLRVIATVLVKGAEDSLNLGPDV